MIRRFLISKMAQYSTSIKSFQNDLNAQSPNLDFWPKTKVIPVPDNKCNYTTANL